MLRVGSLRVFSNCAFHRSSVSRNGKNFETSMHLSRKTPLIKSQTFQIRSSTNMFPTPRRGLSICVHHHRRTENSEGLNGDLELSSSTFTSSMWMLLLALLTVMFMISEAEEQSNSGAPAEDLPKPSRGLSYMEMLEKLTNASLSYTKISNPIISEVYVSTMPPLNITNWDSHDERIGSHDAFFGIYDGHAGRHVSWWLRDELIANYIAPRVVSKDPRVNFTPEEISEKLQSAFVDADKTYLDALQTNWRHRSFQERVGAAATVAYFRRGIESDELFVSGLGDVEAVLVSQNDGNYQIRKLTRVHLCSDPTEQRRIDFEHPTEPDATASGRIKGKHELTRSFGDPVYKRRFFNENSVQSEPNPNWNPPYVSSVPDVSYTVLSPSDRFVVIASSGMLEQLSMREIVTEVQKFLVPGSKRHPTQALLEPLITKFYGTFLQEMDWVDGLFGNDHYHRRTNYFDDCTITVICLNAEKIRSEKKNQKQENLQTAAKGDDEKYRNLVLAEKEAKKQNKNK